VGSDSAEEAILKLDFLRNAIFTRCTTVFASVPGALAEDFLAWLKATLIDKSLSWKSGNTQFSLHLPESVLSSMCIRSALAVQGVSAKRRDQLVEMALTRYAPDPGASELGGLLYSTGRTPLDLTLPWKAKGNVQEGWQVGVVKNAIDPIIQAVLLERSEEKP